MAAIRGRNMAARYDAVNRGVGPVVGSARLYLFGRVEDGGINPAIRSKLDGMLRRTNALWSQLPTGAEDEVYLVRRRWEDGTNMATPDFEHVSRTLQLLNLKAIREIELGKPRTAMATLIDAAHWVAPLRYDPVLSVFRHVGERATIDAAAWILGRWPQDPELLAQARKLLLALGPAPDPKWETILDTGGLGATAQSVADEHWQDALGMVGLSRGPASCTPGFLFLPALRRANEALVLRTYREALSALSPDGEDAERMLDRAAETARRYGDRDDESAWLLAFHRVDVRLESLANRVVRRRLFRCALDVLEHRQRTGNLPKEVVTSGRDSRDPYARASLRLKAVPGGFIVWSVGRDRVDDGGAPKSKDEVISITPSRSVVKRPVGHTAMAEAVSGR